MIINHVMGKSLCDFNKKHRLLFSITWLKFPIGIFFYFGGVNMRDPERVGAGCPEPPEKSQNYRVSLQY